MEAALGFITVTVRGMRERASALVAGWSLAAVAVSSGFVSYTHICALTLDYGQNWKTAHLMALPVDGQIVMGSVYYMKHAGERRRYLGLIGIIPGIAESLYANWQSVATAPGTTWLATWQAHFWATVPAQAFACSTILFERWLQGRAAAASAEADARAEAAEHIAELQQLLTAAGAVTERQSQLLAEAERREAALGLDKAALAADKATALQRVTDLEAELAKRAARRQAAAPGAAPQGGQGATAPAHPAHPLPAGTARPLLPLGTELEQVLRELSANRIAETYDVGRWAVNEAKKDFLAGLRVIGADGRLEWAAPIGQNPVTDGYQDRADDEDDEREEASSRAA